jgi:hypothetical protein
MRIAKWAKALGMKTHYYISPQIWAWKESRISAIKRDIDKMYVILPFENNFTKTSITFLLRSLDIRSSMLFKISLRSMPLLLEEKISWIKTHNRHFTRKPKTRNYKNAFCNAKRC